MHQREEGTKYIKYYQLFQVPTIRFISSTYFKLLYQQKNQNHMETRQAYYKLFLLTFKANTKNIN